MGGGSMKSKLVSLVALCVLSLYPSVSHGQTSNRSVLSVNVPFQFTVGNQTFPAGRYTFQSLLNSVPGKATVDVLVVRSAELRRYTAVVTDVVGCQQRDASLVFVRAG